MSENKAVLIISAIVNKAHMADVPAYLGSVMQIFGQNNGKPIGRYKTVDQLLGEDSPEMVAVIEFPDADTIKQMVEGEAFQALSELRERVFSKLNMVTCVGM